MRDDYSSVMAFGPLVLRFRLIPTLFLAVPIPLFVVLGLWQLDRADQKRELAATLSERAELPAVRIGALVANPDALSYRRIESTGHYLAQRQILIEGRREAGKSGFHVITPLEVSGSGVLLLVNRGWIAAGADGGPTDAPVPAGELDLVGEAYVPSPPALVLNRAVDAANGWGGRWPYLTVDLFAATVGTPVQPVVMLLDPDVPGGFVRHWTRSVPNPGMHLGYAGQWFGFALIALVVYLRLCIEQAPKEETS